MAFRAHQTLFASAKVRIAPSSRLLIGELSDFSHASNRSRVHPMRCSALIDPRKVVNAGELNHV